MIYQIIYKALNLPCLLMTAKSGKNLDTITKSVSLQENLNKIADWCNLWGFKISLNKTAAVIFSQRRIPDVSLSIDNETINTINIETKAKFLGLIFDSKLNCHEHVAYLEEKCKKRLHLMQAVAGNT